MQLKHYAAEARARLILMIRCPTTGRAISTGRYVELATFRSSISRIENTNTGVIFEYSNHIILSCIIPSFFQNEAKFLNDIRAASGGIGGEEVAGTVWPTEEAPNPRAPIHPTAADLLLRLQINKG
jgi:hypothetical protein